MIAPQPQRGDTNGHASILSTSPGPLGLQHQEPDSLARRSRSPPRTLRLQATILKNNVDSPAILIGGVADHIHILALLSRKFAIKDVVEQAKTETSKWLKKQSPRLADFHWQGGYGIFSVSESNVEPVKLYIANQEQHHSQMSFQDEYRLLCQRHGIDIDERYVWD